MYLVGRFNIRQDYTPEEVEEVKRAHPWIYGMFSFLLYALFFPIFGPFHLRANSQLAAVHGRPAARRTAPKAAARPSKFGIPLGGPSDANFALFRGPWVESSEI